MATSTPPSSVINNHLLHTKDYLTEFDTEAYLSAYAFFDMIPSFDVLLKEMVRIFTNVKDRLDDECALEFGGGPTLFSSFLLAQYVKSIHFVDYTPSNLKAVQDWIDRKEDAHDWSELFEKILEEFQERSGDKAAELLQWEERLREAIKRGGISTCNDVNSDYCPILDEPSNANRYSIILSSLCLEDACLTEDVYKRSVKRLNALLKPGGLIFLTHGRNQSFYNVVGKRFFALSINEEKVRDALQEANFADINVTSVAKPRDSFADADGFIVAYAFKK